jgi:hypothetical protein
VRYGFRSKRSPIQLPAEQWAIAARLHMQDVHASEAGAATADAPPRSRASLAALLTGHILNDGELVLFILKPSWAFIPLSSIRFLAGIAIGMIAARVFAESLPYRTTVYTELGLLLAAARLMWAAMQWMGRYYILTDMRIVRLSGVFTVEIYDCPLRKVGRTRLVYTLKERILRTGTIEIFPFDDYPIGSWPMVPRPVEVHEQVVAAVNRARHPHN